MAGCSDDPAFQSLATLCGDLADDICSARTGGCCEGVDFKTCMMAEEERCKGPLAALEAEPSLTFDSVAAAERRSAARDQLDHCGSPPALASFFQDGLADGASCMRDSQCSSGFCSLEGGGCAVVTPQPLCSAQ